MQPAIIQPNGWASAGAGSRVRRRAPALPTSMLSLLDERGAVRSTERAARLTSVVCLLASCAPLGVLTLRGWANGILYLGFLLSLALLASGKLSPARLAPQDRFWARAFVIACVAPVAATVFAALLRGELSLPQFDAPLRSALAIPIFLVVLRSGWPVGRAMQWVLPIALALVLVQLLVVGQDPRWPGERVNTRTVDPLVLGYCSLTFSLMCLVSIVPQEWRAGARARWSILLRLAGVLLGLYLSIRSGSRSGWMAAPIVIGVWMHHHWGRGHRLASAGVIAAALLLPIALYFLVPAVAQRVQDAVKDVVEYPWNGVLVNETSLGYRITYLRIAADLFAMHPWAGVGDTSRFPPVPLDAFSYAHPRAVASAFSSSFHNQVVTNAVRSGVGGIIATLLLLGVPLVVCARGLRRATTATSKDAMMGMAFCTGLVVSSLSTEVVDLKAGAAFYAAMVAAYCGAVLGRRPHAGPGPV
jgi:O-antigen ligase